MPVGPVATLKEPEMPPVKKIVMWILVIFFLYAILTSPDSAAGIVENVWDIIWNGVQNIFEFFNSLLGS